MKKVYEALLNGERVRAEKVNNRWMIGGDYVSKGSQVLIKIKKEGHKDAWYSLRGCFLKFNDFVGEEFND